MEAAVFFPLGHQVLLKKILWCLADFSVGFATLQYQIVISLSSSITCSVVGIVEGKSTAFRFLSSGGRLGLESLQPL